MPIEKIPLKTRLETVSTSAPHFLAVFEIFLEDYFEALTSISGDTCFTDLYNKEICYVNPAKDILLAYVPEAVDKMPHAEAMELMFEILIEPFAKLDELHKEKKSAERSDDVR